MKNKILKSINVLSKNKFSSARIKVKGLILLALGFFCCVQTVKANEVAIQFGPLCGVTNSTYFGNGPRTNFIPAIPGPSDRFSISGMSLWDTNDLNNIIRTKIGAQVTSETVETVSSLAKLSDNYLYSGSGGDITIEFDVPAGTYSVNGLIPGDCYQTFYIGDDVQTGGSDLYTDGTEPIYIVVSASYAVTKVYGATITW